MIPLIVDGTDITFSTVLDKDQGLFEFSGRSRPENVVSYFEPIFNWFDQYKSDPNSETIINFKLEYYNSSSAKVILRLLVKFEEFQKDGMDIKIHWYYPESDEDILESGEDYDSLVDIPFKFIEVE